MSMSQKDYQLIAEAIRYARTQGTNPDPFECVISFLCGALRQDNSRFNSDKFREACNANPRT